MVFRRRHFLFVTRYSLLVRNLLVTSCIIYSLSLQNLLVLIQNLLVIIQNLLIITSKPTRDHFKTYSLLFKNLVKIHQRFFCDKLANISRLRAAPPPPIVSRPSNFLLKIRDITFSSDGGGGHRNKFRQGCSCYFCEFASTHCWFKIFN